MRISTRTLLPLLAVATAVLVPGLALAQDDDPKRPFRQEPRPAVEGELVTLRARGDLCDPATVSCTWSGADGLDGDGEETTHVYDEHGEYTVQITATAKDPATGEPTGAPTIHEGEIRVRRAPEPAPPTGPVEPAPPPPPTTPPTTPPAVPPGTPVTGSGNRPPQPAVSVTGAGTRVDFRSTSTDPDGDELTHRWDFGDGVSSTLASPTHDFARAGTYTVVLLVSDRRGAVAQVTVTVVIQLAGTVTVSAPLVTQPPAGSAAAGTPLLRRLDPFPTVRMAGRILGRSTSVRSLTVRGPRGATVRVTCFRGSCPRAQRIRVTIPRGAGTTGSVRLRRFERRLRAGTTLVVRVTQGDLVGKYTRLRVATGRAPVRTDRCLEPGSSTPVACPR